jgi:acyl carrier protein
MDEKVLSMLKQVRPDIDYKKEKHLLSEGILDSFDFIQIMAKIVEVFGIDFDPIDITVDNFDSAEKIAEFIQDQKQK